MPRSVKPEDGTVPENTPTIKKKAFSNAVSETVDKIAFNGGNSAPAEGMTCNSVIV